jgi:hypothetical protein
MQTIQKQSKFDTEGLVLLGGVAGWGLGLFFVLAQALGV